MTLLLRTAIDHWQYDADMTVFKAYDVRAVYPQPLDETIARKIGFATGKLLLEEAGGSGSVVVGHDMRPSSPALVSAVKEGVLRSHGLLRAHRGRPRGRLRPPTTR